MRKESIHRNMGVPASPERRAEQLREMKASLKRQEEERLEELECVRLRSIEYDRKWAETYAAMGLDDVIEIPGKQGGEDIVVRLDARTGRLL